MPYLVGWFLSMCSAIILERFGLDPKHTIYWVFQIPIMAFIAIALQIVWVDKISARANIK